MRTTAFSCLIFASILTALGAGTHPVAARELGGQQPTERGSSNEGPSDELAAGADAARSEQRQEAEESKQRAEAVEGEMQIESEPGPRQMRAEAQAGAPRELRSNQLRLNESQSNPQRADGGMQRPDGESDERFVQMLRKAYAEGYLAGFADGFDDHDGVLGRRSGQPTEAAGGDYQALRAGLRDRMRSGATGGGQTGPTEQAASGADNAGAAEARVFGAIVSQKRVTLDNDEMEHTLLLVESQSGERVIIDAGPTEQLSDLILDQGEWIGARGGVLQTDDNVAVLVAREIQSTGRRIAISQRSGADASEDDASDPAAARTSDPTDHPPMTDADSAEEHE